jgi:hypothetical protein
MFSGFGDTGVLALVNPSKVRSVPVYEGNKMRVSEMFIAAAIDLDCYKDDLKETDIQDYSQEYFNISVDQLTDTVECGDYYKLDCQNNTVAIPVPTIESIVNILNSKVTEVA